MSETGKEIAAIAQAAGLLMARMTKEEGLGAAESELIRLILTEPGISQKEACRRLAMDKGAVARRMVNLEQKGYLMRKTNPEDGRSQLLYPLEKAEELKMPKLPAEEAFYDWLLEGFSRKERAYFSELLVRLGERAREEEEAGFSHVYARLAAHGYEKKASSLKDSASEDGRDGKRQEAAQKQDKTAPGREPKQERKRDPEIWIL